MESSTPRLRSVDSEARLHFTLYKTDWSTLGLGNPRDPEANPPWRDRTIILIVQLEGREGGNEEGRKGGWGGGEERKVNLEC